MEKIIQGLRSARSKTELLLAKREIEKQLKELMKREEKLEELSFEVDEDLLGQASLVEYRSQGYASFYNTRLEKDKSILTISVAGLGFLITFLNLTTLDNLSYVLLLISSMCFLFCIYTVIKIFDKNADYIISVVTDDDSFAEKEIYLRKLDKRSINAFYIGILLSFVLGLYTSYSNKEIELSKENKSGSSQQYQVVDLEKSAAGASAMKPGRNSSNNSQSSASKQNNKSE
ncbi:hypothetical protein DMJ31_24205 [Vibrio parahaemolyticus]|nr:hypothetical protein [Vibrio parahaemolyticus]